MSWCLNPYNFAPLTETVRRQPLADWFAGSLYSGWITYALDPLSPVAVPDPRYRVVGKEPQEQFCPFWGYETDADAAHRSSKLAELAPAEWPGASPRRDTHVPDKRTDELYRCDPRLPVIPGSEMRGMLRAAHAAFANGCLTQLEQTRALGRRSSDALKYSAFLVARLAAGERPGDDPYGTTVSWSLEPADRFKLNTDPAREAALGLHDTLRDGAIVRFRADDDNVILRGPGITPFLKAVTPHESLTGGASIGERTGMVHRSNYIFRKASETLFAPVPSAPLQIGEEAEQTAIAFFRTLEHYRESNHGEKTYNRTHARMDQLLHRPYELADMEFPLFFPLYHDVARKVFSPAMISYRPSRKQISDFLRDTSHGPCNASDALCPTCAIIGRGLPDNSWMGSLRFSDLVPVDQRDLPARYETLALPELSTPRVTSTEFSLARPKEAGASPSARYPDTTQRAWWDFDTCQSEKGTVRPYEGGRLQGRKFYWHHSGAVVERSDRNKSNPKRSMTVRALRAKTGLKEVVLPEDTNRLEGRIWFDQVPLDTIRQLVWLLTLGDPPDAPDTHAHHVGMGKPVGLGSVRLRPLALQLVEEPMQAEADEGQVAMSQVDLTNRDVCNTWMEAGAQAFAHCRHGADAEMARHFLQARDVKALMLLHDFHVGTELRKMPEAAQQKDRQILIRYPTGVRRGKRGIHFFFALNRNMGKNKPAPFHQVLKQPFALSYMREFETLRDMLLMDLEECR